MHKNTRYVMANEAAHFEAACLAELEAIKPGNVHVFADGHGMVVQDFITSARVAAPEIAKPEYTVGQRILSAVSATIKAVGCNTNLGIILLAAPMIHASIHQLSLRQVLGALTVEDAVSCYEAIRLASPAGLGEAALHDVHAIPSVTLLQAMQAAAARDRIAYQYANCYADVLEIGVEIYGQAMRRRDNLSWAATAVYLGFLSAFPDTHVARKHGEAAAVDLQHQAKAHEMAFLAQDNPKRHLGELLHFDAGLKREGLNPGTSADLTVATLLACRLGLVAG